ncbi:MurR/RpiR family transcriptional regulator [Celeribacter baekdonensis]|uniref:MurR/RpiR family transcriptional regulator n=1 Tax=Celeribacter baekdonensis TaxID=875171 RepID=UPI002671CE13|nr:MurR/RpiR family transcriptional regulator [Celeribacter baekdonensis]
MNETGKSSFLGAVRENLSRMPPTERRLAEFLLSFPGELASYNASELAKLANVSNATVSRFVQRLGYASYEDARRHVRTEQNTGAAIYLSGTKQDAASDLIDLYFAQGARNLTDTGKSMSIAEVDEIADAILSARRVALFGFRSSQAFASYLHWQMLQVVDSSRLLPQPGQTLTANPYLFILVSCASRISLLTTTDIGNQCSEMVLCPALPTFFLRKCCAMDEWPVW